MSKKTSLKRRAACMIIALAVMLSMTVVPALAEEATETYPLTASGSSTFTSTNDPDNQVIITLTSGGFEVLCNHQDAYDQMDIQLIPVEGDSDVLKKAVTEENGSLEAGGSWTVTTMGC